MGINYFTEDQIKDLEKNPYVKKKAITYTEEFKDKFLILYNQGKSPSYIR